ncbi:hypothetical protein JCM10449v2_001950 [Rhodotorula kratochvilovae]
MTKAQETSRKRWNDEAVKGAKKARVQRVQPVSELLPLNQDTPSPRIPLELIDRIVAGPDLDRDDFIALSLTCRHLAAVAQPRVWESFTIKFGFVERINVIVNLPDEDFDLSRSRKMAKKAQHLTLSLHHIEPDLEDPGRWDSMYSAEGGADYDDEDDRGDYEYDAWGEPQYKSREDRGWEDYADAHGLGDRREVVLVVADELRRFPNLTSFALRDECFGPTTQLHVLHRLVPKLKDLWLPYTVGQYIEAVQALTGVKRERAEKGWGDFQAWVEKEGVRIRSSSELPALTL